MFVYTKPSDSDTDALMHLNALKLFRLTVIVGDDVQAVEKLSFVFMDSLHLDVKHGVGIDLYLVVFLQVCCKLQLVFLCELNIGFIV